LELFIEMDVEPAWETAVWVAWRPATWICWLPWAFLPLDMVFVMSMAFSSRTLKMAGRWKALMTGCSWTIPGNFPSLTIECRSILAGTPSLRMMVTAATGSRAAAYGMLGEPTICSCQIWQPDGQYAAPVANTHSQEFDLRFFDVGDYAKAVEQMIISKVSSKR
jgi:hypothetical protein